MPLSEKPKMAVIGLGSMGFGMATSLRRAGFEVTGCDVSAEVVSRFVSEGGKGARTPAAAMKILDLARSPPGCTTEPRSMLIRRRVPGAQRCHSERQS